MTDDALFLHIEHLHGKRPWGRLLDAGTGADSLGWITSLDCASWTAVTADRHRARELERGLTATARAKGRIVAGNWADSHFLHGEVFDVVLADYLVGALDRFAPYLQYDFFRRLRPHAAARLYVVGLEPYDEEAATPGARLIREIARLRDACILLAGHRCHREYPLDWTVRRLEDSGFTVEDVTRFPIVYGPRFINGQLDVALRKLEHLPDRFLARGLHRRIDTLRRQALALYEAHRGIRFGFDYIVSARPG